MRFPIYGTLETHAYQVQQVWRTHHQESPPPSHSACRRYSLAIVKYDSAVGPTVVVHQAQVRKDAHTHSLQASLVTESETIAVDLPRERIQICQSTDLD